MSIADYSTDPNRTVVVKQQPNFYTALLLVAVVALAIGCLFLFLELNSYGLSVEVPADAKVQSVSFLLDAPTWEGQLLAGCDMAASSTRV